MTLRRDLERLAAKLAAIGGIQDIALTANGALLARKARTLADAGLRRVTVSLDSLDDAVFMALNDAGFPCDRPHAESGDVARRRLAGREAPEDSHPTRTCPARQAGR
jgi:MoaA/NifB/PqqE/SkfB family radical SAM enzyme